MDYSQSRVLERNTIPIFKISELFLDGCFQKWMGSLFQRKPEDTWEMVTDGKSLSYKRVGGKSFMDSLKSVEGYL